MIPLPVLAAGGGIIGWLVGRAARSSEAAGDVETPAAAAAPADATAAESGGAALDWGQDLSTGGGVLPGVGASPVGDDWGSDYTEPTIPPPATQPPPASTPAPTPAPAPAPAGTVIAKPRTPAPSGAVGWTIVKVGQTYWNPVAGWGGGYPVHFKDSASYATTTARWIGAVHTGIRPSGSKVDVRRVSHRDTVGPNWADDFVYAAVAKIYPASTASVRI